MPKEFFFKAQVGFNHPGHIPVDVPSGHAIKTAAQVKDFGMI
jgi:hypothetical protein